MFRETLRIYNEAFQMDVQMIKVMQLFYDETGTLPNRRLNVLTLWTRYYIYQSFIHNDQLSQTALRHSIKTRLHMLKIINKADNKLEYFEQTWNQLYKWFN